ncbi:YdeI/OmpD-associated family protein [Akkermansia sp.]|uniref:YdeI/OmpD-associated family protein n=1 Tax=Akkermansia sp. TaxID=1872421 RepID=UPI0025B9CFA7|nr:YdeI/OmpD-associated family protein [Akkermansia sp.]MCC8148206.1 YdeI/OmpD-associated family protein [Akkermansia sp.]
MEITRLLPITTREELRTWLEQHHRSSSCCWVPTTRKPSLQAILYLDAVEEALCFGWIDSTRKKTASGFLAQRLSPRARGSKWSELNKERVRRLDRLGLMTPHGKKCLPEMDPEAFRIDPDILKALQQDPRTYANFLAFPRLYRHVRLDTIQIKKNQPELFRSRLEKFLENTRENRMYGEWNDGGRLLEK